MKKTIPAIFLTLVLTGQGRAGEPDRIESLTADFRKFLTVYIEKIRQEDAAYLASIHPELPTELYAFFFDATQGMMRHAATNGLRPSVTCREYAVCKATWPQPNDSWAAQTFIRHQGKWRWLSE